MIFIYAAVAKETGSAQCAVKAEVYEGLDGESLVRTDARIVSARTVEQAYLMELGHLLDDISVDENEKVVFYTTESIAAHGNNALIESGTYPNVKIWKKVIDNIRYVKNIPEFKSHSRWGETLLAETKEYLEQHKTVKGA